MVRSNSDVTFENETEVLDSLGAFGNLTRADQHALLTRAGLLSLGFNPAGGEVSGRPGSPVPGRAEELWLSRRSAALRNGRTV